MIQKPQKPRFRGAEIQKKFLGGEPPDPTLCFSFSALLGINSDSDPLLLRRHLKSLNFSLLACEHTKSTDHVINQLSLQYIVLRYSHKAIQGLNGNYREGTNYTL